MSGKSAGIFLLLLAGSIFILAGVILLASAWVSSNLYNFTVDIIVYSPWLDWGLIGIGAILILAGIFAGREG